MIYGDPGMDVIILPVVVDGGGISEESDGGIEYGHDIGAGGDVGE